MATVEAIAGSVKQRRDLNPALVYPVHRQVRCSVDNQFAGSVGPPDAASFGEGRQDADRGVDTKHDIGGGVRVASGQVLVELEELLVCRVGPLNLQREPTVLRVPILVGNCRPTSS